jgi:hypothetical protein
VHPEHDQPDVDRDQLEAARGDLDAGQPSKMTKPQASSVLLLTAVSR